MFSLASHIFLPLCVCDAPGLTVEARLDRWNVSPILQIQFAAPVMEECKSNWTAVRLIRFSLFICFYQSHLLTAELPTGESGDTRVVAAPWWTASHRRVVQWISSQPSQIQNLVFLSGQPPGLTLQKVTRSSDGAVLLSLMSSVWTDRSSFLDPFKLEDSPNLQAPRVFQRWSPSVVAQWLNVCRARVRARLMGLGLKQILS